MKVGERTSTKKGGKVLWIRNEKGIRVCGEKIDCHGWAGEENQNKTEADVTRLSGKRGIRPSCMEATNPKY